MASSAKQTFQSKNRTKSNARTISSHNSESSHHTIHNSGDIAAFPIPRNDSKDLQREVSCGNDSSRMNSNFFQVRKSKAVSEEVFLPYLAQDEVGIDVAETQEVVDQLNKEIRSLLSLKFREFWQQVTSSRSLREFLDSYLHFRRRWYDLPPCKATGAVDNIIVGDGDLSRRVFMVLYRMASHQEPGVLNSESLSFEEHSSLLRKHKLLDLTKLLDISALYSHDNPQLTRKLVSNAIKAQLDFQYQIGEMVPHIVKTMRTMHHRCSSIVEAYDDMNRGEGDIEGLEKENDLKGRKRAKREAILGLAVDRTVSHESSGLKSIVTSTKSRPAIKKKQPVLQIKIAPKRISEDVSKNNKMDSDNQVEMPQGKIKEERPKATREELLGGKMSPTDILSRATFKELFLLARTRWILISM